MWESLVASVVARLLEWGIEFGNRQIEKSKRETLEAEAREYRAALEHVKRAKAYRDNPGSADLWVQPGSPQVRLPGPPPPTDRNTPRDAV